MRKRLVVANWKMHGSFDFRQSMSTDLNSALTEDMTTSVVVCPPFPYLYGLSENLTVAEVGGQDISSHESGAYTGEVSASMLADVKASWVILGHSERRAYHHETDERVVEKARLALAAGLKPICCVGETLEQRESGNTESVVGQQVAVLVDAFEKTGQLSQLVIAYEPVWAIGTGKTASPEQAQAVHRYIRNMLGSEAESMAILYGGSVKPSNAAELFGQPDIDGGLIGGASLVAQDFIDICLAAENTEK